MWIIVAVIVVVLVGLILFSGGDKDVEPEVTVPQDTGSLDTDLSGLELGLDELDSGLEDFDIDEPGIEVTG